MFFLCYNLIISQKGQKLRRKDITPPSYQTSLFNFLQSWIKHRLQEPWCSFWRLALWVKFSADDILKSVSFFSLKTGFNMSCKFSPNPIETIDMKCQILFSGKNKKNINNLSSAELPKRVVKVNIFVGVSLYFMKYNRVGIITKTEIFQIELIFFIFLLKHRLWILIRTASARRF